jgi:cytochrome c556
MLAVLGFAQAATPVTEPTDPAGAAEPSPPRLTIQQLMATRVDPAADVLWDSVAFIASAKGEEDRRPRTPAQWETVHRSALALIDAVDDLSALGRRVAPGRQPGPGELPESAMQRLIDSHPAAFTRRARVLKSAAEKALASIDAKDAEGLMDAGGLIDEACEACHRVYWYPHQARSARVRR